MATIQFDTAKLKEMGTEGAFKIIKRMGMDIEREAKLSVAVDTGRLRASISTVWTGQSAQDLALNFERTKKGGLRVTRNKGTRVAIAEIIKGLQAPGDPMAVRVGTNVHYAAHVEFGTHRMAARPYLIPAYNKVMQDFGSGKYGGNRND